MPRLEILYQDNHLLVVNKPAGLATMGARDGPTLHSLAASYLKRTCHKPGKAFVGIVSRLDTMTSGVVVLARTSKAAARLSAQFADKQAGADKVYLAAVDPPLQPSQAVWTDWLAKDERAHRMRIVEQGAAHAKSGTLRYLAVDDGPPHAMLAVHLLTGRKHQIRVQLADRGHPILGDRKYGSSRRFPTGVALHSWRLRIQHPTRREPLWFAAPLPASWQPLRGPLADEDRVWQDVQLAFGFSDLA